jgi:hypothetical protein
MSSIKLFSELANIDKMGVSQIVCATDFKDKYSKLKLGNGSSWCRFDGLFGKKYKVMTIKKNGTISFSWDIDDVEKDIINKEVDELIQKKKIVIEKGTSIKYIKLYGYQVDPSYLRPISQKIRDHFNGKPCVVCGSNSNIVIDHKNGLYNDKRVLNADTQDIDDFQVLCNHCNLQKRQTIKHMKKCGKRYSALDIPSISMFNIDFTKGDENYDKTDPKWSEGTYWNDPCDFIKKCIILQKDKSIF